ncbi:hypothetical protein Pyrfu_1506 [Pyrolobus fumarii 1A]|uniref:Uncharacterized protein n=1 Tax=Pyrolobus fumarii (strain DSM 11204 / 1A) TaxID=694429 RepID=G0EHL0_PYRF1|nr:hypothetical protein [Pyrolobus fumarii]AEM39363.1 hypothetical protein Pyrfu_1506 [Pyrolobus fumarii 1A]
MGIIDKFFVRKDARKELEMILSNMSPWHSALFYADEEVSRILQELYNRWEQNDRRGEPLDYAKDDELELLLAKAKRVARMPAWQAFRGVVSL